MLLIGKRTLTYFITPLTYGRVDRRANIGVRLNETGDVTTGQAEHIINDQDLAITVRSRANPDRWNGELLGYPLGYLNWNTFHNDGKRTRILSCQGIIQQSFLIPLDLVTTHGVNTLGP